MIRIRDRLINPARVTQAQVETRHYVNGSASYLIVRLDDGSVIQEEHGYGFDAWDALKKIEEA
jgi:hypothetical protein